MLDIRKSVAFYVGCAVLGVLLAAITLMAAAGASAWLVLSFSGLAAWFTLLLYRDHKIREMFALVEKLLLHSLSASADFQQALQNAEAEIGRMCEACEACTGYVGNKPDGNDDDEGSSGGMDDDGEILIERIH